MQSGEDDGPEVSLRKLTQHFGVLGYVILNGSGIPIKYHGMENPRALKYAALVSELSRGTQNFLQARYKDPEDKLITSEPQMVSLRLRTRKHEIIVAPDENFTLIVIQNPNYVEPPAPVLTDEEKAQQAESGSRPGTTRGGRR